MLALIANATRINHASNASKFAFFEVCYLRSNVSNFANKLGAQHFVVSKDEKAMKALNNTFDFFLDTVSAKHEIAPYINMLKTHGVFALVGAPAEPFALPGFPLIMQNKTITGSLIGGIKETQEMMDYCAEHNIVSEVEVIGFDKLEEAYDRTLKSDVKYRFVLDVATLKK